MAKRLAWFRDSSQAVDGQTFALLAPALRPDHPQGVILLVEAGVHALVQPLFHRIHVGLQFSLDRFGRSFRGSLGGCIEALDTLLVKGTFPPFMLVPVNFDILYAEARKRRETTRDTD